MKILKMTATFGNLDRRELVLEPGLNVVEAPNEWGQSTWCAFIYAMLYGLDTRAKTSRTGLADKERYAPRSGAPMSGTMDIRWKGRDITLQRTTRGRIPMGDFRAFETHTGLPVPELTARNCGTVLLGVEGSVFRRGGFIRFRDLPVTQDEALRRRLNALVTTGDEGRETDRLGAGLKELKNRCRYNRTGLIPQTQEVCRQLEEKLEQRQELESRIRRLRQRISENGDWLRDLENHEAALGYAAAEADAHRVARARDSRDEALTRLEALEARCAGLPREDLAREKLKGVSELLREEGALLHQEQQPAPVPPESPPPFSGLDPGEAKDLVEKDTARYRRLSRKTGIFLLLAGLGLLGAALWLRQWVPAAGGTVLGICGLVLTVVRLLGKGSLTEKYGSPDPECWGALLSSHLDRWEAYRKESLSYRRERAEWELQREELEKRRAALCGGQKPEAVAAFWQEILDSHRQLDAARQGLQRHQEHLDALQAMAKSAPAPAREDRLDFTGPETAGLLQEARQEQLRLKSRLDQYLGRAEGMEDIPALEAQLEKQRLRLQQLERTEAALTLAGDTLVRARQELQRRFAPRITGRARELMCQLTGGRYDRLLLGEDFSLQAAAREENTLSDTLWFSDGTVDQLYLALRLAVAETLTPEAPLVLDDALVRFDDARLAAAMAVLARQAQNRQVIVFTCTGREGHVAGAGRQ